MGFWNKILISIHRKDEPVRKMVESLIGPVGKVYVDENSIILFKDTKRSFLPDTIWKLKAYNWLYPESAQIMFQGEDDFKYRLIDLFPEKQKILDDEENRTPASHPLHFNDINGAKPPYWDASITTCIPNSKNWIICPGCGTKFKTTDENVFVNGRHYCGQNILIGSKAESDNHLEDE